MNPKDSDDEWQPIDLIEPKKKGPFSIFKDDVDHIYIVISPNPMTSTTTWHPNPGNGDEGMWLKIGLHSEWDGGYASYRRCNPNFWFRSIKIGKALPNDLFGRDAAKQIQLRLLEGQPYQGKPFSPIPYYTKEGQTEWFRTVDESNMQLLVNLAHNWDEIWDPRKMSNPLRGSNVICVEQSSGNESRGTTRGPQFLNRNAAFDWFRNILKRHGGPLKTVPGK